MPDDPELPDIPAAPSMLQGPIQRKANGICPIGCRGDCCLPEEVKMKKQIGPYAPQQGRRPRGGRRHKKKNSLQPA